ncbi:hypothetical protein ACA086_10865 [Muriicola sp. E247]|uniref:hypothetical protein n=1 Tax=Muriicola sp. E247 TaxID=3242730 RepID=UPI003523FED8
MKKLLSFMFIASLLLVSCEVEQFDGQELTSVDGKASKKGNVSASSLTFEMDGCSGSERDLIAGQNMVVGTVSVDEVGEDYVITYNITEDGYCLTEAHVDVATLPEYFQMTKSGNPKIGNFDYVNDGVECNQNYTVIVANTGPWLAVHGVVVCATNSVESVVDNLPEIADFCTTVQGPNSYLNISITEGPLAGDFEAWCVDNDKGIEINTCYDGADIYSSTGSLPDGTFEYPENFDKVNYLLNQSIVGQPCTAGGVFTYGDLQLAIWKLLDDISTGSIAGLGAYSNACVDEILAMAEAGEGFEPECGQILGIIVNKAGNQPLIIPYPLECSPCDETIWADGCSFPGSNWAMYFEYSDN